ncbi:tRNA (adenosine(37)-N6)-dimethylallyltransferase MiaA [Bacteroidales bacterium]|nr:tRNA (adenosine(37)-N6)-dimethylallyltransferase MiaA [Bacteroidales bacterium]
MDKELIIVTGPTAIGKTKLAIELSGYYGTEIVSCDSRQMYKEMQVGTAVPSIDELSAAKHHFIQVISIFDYYNAAQYEVQAIALLHKLFEKYNKVILTGGTGLYIDAICRGIDDLPTVNPELRANIQDTFEKEGIQYLQEQVELHDPEYYAKVDINNPMRLMKALEVSIMSGKPYSQFLTRPAKKRDFTVKKIFLNMDREKLYDRINQRVLHMIDEGLEQEAKDLFGHRGQTALKTVGYRELFDMWEGKHDHDEAIRLIQRNTRHYARKQLTWFKRYQDGVWFEPTQIKDIISHIG